MLIGYMRVSKADGSQVIDLQRDALLAAGVEPSRLYQAHASGKKNDRRGLETCLKSMREDDTLLVLEFNSAGMARTLYPTAAASNPALTAQQTVFVAGTPSADLTLTGLAGAEQVLAVCTTALPPAAPNAATDAVVVSRNLSVVANHQGTAMASVIFTVEP